MSTETTVPAIETPISAPPVETPAPAPSPDPTSAPEPVAASDEPAEGSIRDHKGRFSRHRAESQRATREDVPRIKELTAKWREAEKREKALIERISKIEQSQPKPQPAPTPADVILRAPQPSAPKPFDEPRPTLEQFANEPDPYAAHLKADWKWEQRKEAHEAQQAQAQQFGQADEQQQQAALAAIGHAYNQRLQAFVQTSAPDFQHLINTVGRDRQLPALAFRTIQLAENGPALLYTMLKSPVLLDEVHLLTDGKPVTPETVAMTQRWLAARVAAVAPPPGATGSAPAVSSYTPAPKPPSGVRTSAMKASETPLPEGSVMAHAKQYWRK